MRGRGWCPGILSNNVIADTPTDGNRREIAIFVVLAELEGSIGTKCHDKKILIVTADELTVVGNFLELVGMTNVQPSILLWWQLLFHRFPATNKVSPSKAVKTSYCVAVIENDGKVNAP